MLTTTSESLKRELLGTDPYIKPSFYQSSDKLGWTYIACDFGQFLYCATYPHRDKYDLVTHGDKFLQAFDMLSDEDSEKLFYDRILRDQCSIISLKDHKTSSPYFPEEIKKRMTDSEVFIDCGAYTGDTLEEFKKQTNNVFKSAYLFEMDDEIFQRLTKNPNVNDSRIRCIQAGVSDRDCEITYRKDGCPSYAIQMESAENTGRAKLKCIDGLVENGVIQDPITFVKMDIEGAEIDALRGMEKTMQRDRPKLAICVYHRPDDLWEIPLYIKSIVPQYEFVLRHHAFLNCDTVLYAYIE